MISLSSKPGRRLRIGADAKRAMRCSILVFVWSRLALLLIGVFSVAVFPSRVPASVPGWPAPSMDVSAWHQVFSAWERFDALWFLRIASSGYHLADGSAAFFPLDPIMVRAFSFLIGGHPLLAAFLVSNGAFLCSLFVLYVLTTSEVSEAVARKTLLYLAIFPTTFFFFAPYSESLFLLLTVLTFWAARRRRWGIAGLAAALATLTRGIGIVLAPALLMEALHQRREGDSGWALGLASTCGPVLAWMTYLAYWGSRSGDWLAPLHQEAKWLRVFSWPWVTLWRGTGFALGFLGHTFEGYWQIDWVILTVVLVAAVLATLRFRPSYGVYLWCSLLIPLIFVFPNRPLMSMPRFVLPLFPAFWVIGILGSKSRQFHAVMFVMCIVGLVFLTPLYVNWYFIF